MGPQDINFFRGPWFYMRQTLTFSGYCNLKNAIINLYYYCVNSYLLGFYREN